jgi:hypothetical protein
MGLLTASVAFSQSTATEPVPFEEEEIPQWLEKLYRAQTVAVGAFPFAIMLSGLGYDFYLFGDSGFSSDFIPWPPGNVTTAWLASGATQDDLNQRNAVTIASSLGISLTVALIDYILGELSER